MSTHSSNDSSSSRPPRARKKQSKPLYLVRKEEKRRLEEEESELQTQIEYLKKQRVVQSSALNTLENAHRTNMLLRDGVEHNFESLAAARSILNDTFGGDSGVYFLGKAIRLTKDPQQRYDLLHSLLPDMMHSGRESIKQRFHGIDPSLEMSESRKRDLPSGSYDYSSCKAVHFTDEDSVKQVFDRNMFQIVNLDISISSQLEEMALRENAGNSLSGSLHQNRMVTENSDGFTVEINVICFCEYKPSDPDMDGRPSAMVVVQSVEEDELYPYQPEERVQESIQLVIQLTTTLISQDIGGKPSGKEIVVARWWNHEQLHKPMFPVPRKSWKRFKARIEEVEKLFEEKMEGKDQVNPLSAVA